MDGFKSYFPQNKNIVEQIFKNQYYLSFDSLLLI